MLSEVVAALSPRDGASYVDGTLWRRRLCPRHSGSLPIAAFWASIAIPTPSPAGRCWPQHFAGRLTLVEGEIFRHGAAERSQ